MQLLYLDFLMFRGWGGYLDWLLAKKEKKQ